MAECKYCGFEIIWDQTTNRGWIPRDKDGMDHRGTCPAMRKKKPGSFIKNGIDYTRIGIGVDQTQLSKFGFR